MSETLVADFAPNMAGVKVRDLLKILKKVDPNASIRNRAFGSTGTFRGLYMSEENELVFVPTSLGDLLTPPQLTST
jgi:hypothetical protein